MLLQIVLVEDAASTAPCRKRTRGGHAAKGAERVRFVRSPLRGGRDSSLRAPRSTMPGTGSGSTKSHARAERMLPRRVGEGSPGDDQPASKYGRHWSRV